MKKIIYLVLGFFCFVAALLSISGWAQTVNTFTSSSSFTVPCGVYSIQVECWGPGGGGGGDGTNGGTTGSGGGGGGYSTATIAVTPGQVIAYTVGTGGGGGGGNANGNAGSGATTFSTVSANAGGGGAFNSGVGGAVGTGTTNNGIIGTVGANPSPSGAGGAGGNGGAGGLGISAHANGNPGTIPGGGGGGAYDNAGGSTTGGAGARGEIKITFSSNLTPGTYTIGPSGDNYASITEVLCILTNAALTGAVIFELQSDYVSTVETFPLVFPAVSGASSANSITFRPASGATNLSVTSANATATMQFSNGDYFIFDGRPGGSGSLAATNLTIANTSTTGIAIELINDATYNTIKYCYVKGVNTGAAEGVIVFSTTTATTGNDYNSIDYCDIGLGASTPANCIYAAGTAAKENDNNTVSNCNIHDFFLAANARGILISSNNTAWTISGNSFYQTATRAGELRCIDINNTSGVGFTVSNNYIGGSAALAAGGALTVSAAATYKFWGIYLNVSTSGTSYIENNFIKNINYTGNANNSVTSVNFSGIYVDVGDVLIDENTIGDNSTGSITISLTVSGANIGAVFGIDNEGSGSVTNNTIGSITVGGTIDKQRYIMGIVNWGTVSSGMEVSGNTIGHPTTANSIQGLLGATPPSFIAGIYTDAPGGNYSILNNEIANLTEYSTSNNTGCVLYGITSNETSAVTSGNNIIHDLTSATSNKTDKGFSATLAFIGIAASNGGIVTNNSIYNMKLTTPAVKPLTIGVSVLGGTGNIVSKNLIYNLESAADGTILRGIWIANGGVTATVSNNMIRLGYNVNGTSSTLASYYTGITKSNTAACNFYFNTIYIGGTGVNNVAANFSSCFERENSGSDNCMDNIFMNTRSNAGAGANHYAIVVDATTTFTSDYNELYSSTAANLGSYDAGTTPRDFTAWKTGTSQDANSQNIDAVLVSPTATTPDLHLGPLSPLIGGQGVVIAGITDDYESDIRRTTASPSGPCIGADERISSPVGSANGIYSPDGIGGTITGSEIYATGGNPGGHGYLVAKPTEYGYTSVGISGYPEINAGDGTNAYINCTNRNINMLTSATSPDWTGSDAPLTGTGSPKTVAYSSTGRKDVVLNSAYSSQNFSSTVNTAIPDASSCGGINNTISVSGYTGNIATSGISVTLNITHTNDGDLQIWLKGPGGTEIIMLSYRLGGTGNDFTNTVLSDAGATNISTGSAPFTGTFKPHGLTGSICALSINRATFGAMFGGSVNPNGDWTIYVSDYNATQTGTFVDWSISFPTYTGTSTYTDFNNMLMAPPSAGSILGIAAACPASTSTFTSSEAGASGFAYFWSYSTTGGSASIATPTLSSTDITFTNATGSNQTFTIKLDITSECCGPLAQVTKAVTIYPVPAAPTVSGPVTICGGSTTISASAPAGSTFNWYDASSGGTIYTWSPVSSYDVSPVSTTTYWSEAVSAFGCLSTTRTGVTVTISPTAAPTTTPGSTCGSGTVLLSVTPVAGYTYSWYSGSCGGTLVGSSTTFITPVISSNTTYYVGATAPGCVMSPCASVLATVNTPPAPINWENTAPVGPNNWFNSASWEDGCIPTCASNVVLNGTGNQPDIGFNAIVSSEAKDVTISSTRTLSFSDSKANLKICGNFYHNGTLTTNNLGSITFNGTVAQAYTVTGGTGNFNDLIINNSSATGLTLSQNSTLGSSGVLFLTDGELLLNSKILTISNSSASAITGGSAASYIKSEGENSKVQWNIGGTTGAHVFPFGLSGNYLPITFNNSGASGNITAATWATNDQNTPKPSGVTDMIGAGDSVTSAANRFWNINSTVANPLPSVDLAFSYIGTENNNTTSPTDTRGVQHWNGSCWDDGKNGGCASVTASADAGVTGAVVGTVAVTGITYFSPFVIVRRSNPLPIEIIEFSAFPLNSHVILHWQTATEINNDFFTIERGKEGDEFSEVAKIKSKAPGGNSSVGLDYNAKDEKPFKGVSYYRLKQTDFDGKYSYSNVVAVEFREGIRNLYVYPNPAINKLNIVVGENEKSVVKIYDVTGQIVSESVICNQPNGICSVDIDILSTGVYFVSLFNGIDTRYARFVKE